MALVREKRAIRLSALWDPITTDSFDSVVEPRRFLPADAPRWPGHWTSLPPGRGAAPEERLLSGEGAQPDPRGDRLTSAQPARGRDSAGLGGLVCRGGV